MLWNSIVQELTHFRDLTVFCYSHWWPPWSTEVYSTDASLYGYGLAASDWSREEVAEAGRRNERSRYRLGAESAREHALAQIGFVVDHDIGKVREAGSEDKASIPLMGAERWEEDPGFEEIPPSLLVGSRWRTLSCGRWFFEDDILHLESRGIDQAVSRAANCRPSCDCRVLILNDNLSVVLAFARSRAREFRLITQIRLMCASSLARNISFYFRWIPSELNSGDFGSRRYDPFYDPAKTLVLVHRIGSKPVFLKKQVRDQSPNSDPFVTTKISESEGSPRTAFLSGTGVDSNKIDLRSLPCSALKISRNRQGIATPAGDRTKKRRQRRGRRGGARLQ